MWHDKLTFANPIMRMIEYSSMYTKTDRGGRTTAVDIQTRPKDGEVQVWAMNSRTWVQISTNEEWG